MDPRAARWNKLYWQTVRSPPSALASAGPWACAHGIQDVAPAGAEEPKLFGEGFLLHSG